VAKSIIIIGSGMGGMAAGIYGQMSGFETRIFEMHYLPGGQCASWKRSSYTFDVCIHHLMGCSPTSKINQLWTELGAMPREFAYTKECVSVISEDGEIFYDYYDPDILNEHLHKLAPQDSKIITEYIDLIKQFAKLDLMGQLMLGKPWDMLKLVPALLKKFKWLKLSMGDFAKSFTDPFMQKAFPLLVYSEPSIPFLVHLARHGCGCNKDIAWPIGASSEFARSIAKHY